jgi:phospholipase/carboxylesterase
MTTRSLLSVLVLAGCGAASGTVLPAERAARVVTPPALEVVPLPYDAPGVHIEPGELEGLAYAEVVLGDVEAEDALPLVVALHGFGDAPRFPAGPVLRTGLPMRLVLPRGPLPAGSGAAWSTHRVREGNDAALTADLELAADRVARLTDALARSRPTAGSPVVMGFSQGAMVAWFASQRHPGTFGVALVGAGWLPPAMRDGLVCGTPLRAVHGLGDAVVPVEPARAAVLALAARGCITEWVEVSGVGHEVVPPLSDVFERWLEEALHARAPHLPGGLGALGPEPEDYLASPSPLLALPALLAPGP